MDITSWRLINLYCLVLAIKLLFSLQMICVGNYVQKKPLNVCKQQVDAPANTANPLSCSDAPQTNNNEQLVEWLLATR